MNAVSVDVRMMRRGQKWCATACIKAPCLSAPVNLYVESDVKDAMRVLRSTTDMLTREHVARASSMARKDARRRILGYTYNLFREMGPEMKGYGSHVRKGLEACDTACDLVSRARGGDQGARAAIETIFIRAKGGEADALKSARLILESAELVDDGRTSFKVKVKPSDRSSKPKAPELPMPKASTSGLGEYLGSSVENPVGKRVPERLLEQVWDQVPYPMDRVNFDRNGYGIFQVLDPSVAAF